MVIGGWSIIYLSIRTETKSSIPSRKIRFRITVAYTSDVDNGYIIEYPTSAKA